jgi:hypothetical protein
MQAGMQQKRQKQQQQRLLVDYNKQLYLHKWLKSSD